MSSRVFPQAINDIAAACDASGVSMPSACLSWCLKQPPVQAVIVGARNAEQVSRNARLAALSQVSEGSHNARLAATEARQRAEEEAAQHRDLNDLADGEAPQPATTPQPTQP